jgi:hypothetical protein
MAGPYHMPSPTALHSTDSVCFARNRTEVQYSTTSTRLSLTWSMEEYHKEFLAALSTAFTLYTCQVSSLGSSGVNLLCTKRLTRPDGDHRVSDRNNCQSRSSYVCSTAGTTAVPCDGMGGKQRSSMAACEGPVLHC